MVQDPERLLEARRSIARRVMFDGEPPPREVWHFPGGGWAAVYRSDNIEELLKSRGA